ncbi:MAG: chemotaxis protein CheB [Kofleriaceae bacterium]
MAGLADSPLPQTRDIICIGCSAGGVEALPRIIQQLPKDLPASVFIVQHMAATETPYLVEILQRNTRLPIQWAEQGMRSERGQIYVAPPDVHLVFADEHLVLTRTARENHSRPSIDKLFRSAAAVHASRVIGVLLTGMLDDGVAGLRAIRDAGGAVVVQDPNDAAFPDLPARALLALEPDRTLPIDAIGGALLALTAERPQPVTVPVVVLVEAAIDQTGPILPERMHELGAQTTISCPDCGGPMWQMGDERIRRYRCYNGHAMTAADMLAASNTQVEAALWSAVRALNDRAGTLETLASDAERIGNVQSGSSYASRARDARREAELAREFMLSLGRPR